MTWYEEATRAIVAKIIATLDETGDGPCSEEIAAIIAKHDPSRWIPVEERLPSGKEFDESGNPTLIVAAFSNDDGEAFVAPFGNGKFLYFSELYDDDWWPLDKQPTHWRPINLPEVKG